VCNMLNVFFLSFFFYLILELYDFHNLINLIILIHRDLFFNMLIIDYHKIDLLLLDHFFTFTRLSDGEEYLTYLVEGGTISFS